MMRPQWVSSVTENEAGEKPDCVVADARLSLVTVDYIEC